MLEVELCAIGQPIRLNGIIPHPWSYRQSWLTSVCHKMKQKDMNVGEDLAERSWGRGQDRGQRNKSNQDALYLCVKFSKNIFL